MTLKSVILIRHAESLEDVDPNIHNIADDNAIGLTEFGKTQAKEIGGWILSNLPSATKVKVVLSPSNRARETWQVISPIFTNITEVKTDERIRNLNWGNVTLETRASVEAERYAVGVLHYCFSGGTNTPEYVHAIDQFVDEVILGCNDVDFPDHIVMVTHGFALRVIARLLLNVSEEEFRRLRNPPNGYRIEFQYVSRDQQFFATEPLLVVK
jgi:broad specificity phosphatase PhoE